MEASFEEPSQWLESNRGWPAGPGAEGQTPIRRTRIPLPKSAQGRAEEKSQWGFEHGSPHAGMTPQCSSDF